MRRVWGMTLLVGASVGLFLGPQRVFAQACKDEVSMVEGSKQALVELTETVKKESLPDFERHNHQKSAVNKLSFTQQHVGRTGELPRKGRTRHYGAQSRSGGGKSPARCSRQIAGKDRARTRRHQRCASVEGRKSSYRETRLDALKIAGSAPKHRARGDEDLSVG